MSTWEQAVTVLSTGCLLWASRASGLQGRGRERLGGPSRATGDKATLWLRCAQNPQPGSSLGSSRPGPTEDLGCVNWTPSWVSQGFGSAGTLLRPGSKPMYHTGSRWGAMAPDWGTRLLAPPQPAGGRSWARSLTHSHNRQHLGESPAEGWLGSGCGQSLCPGRGSRDRRKKQQTPPCSPLEAQLPVELLALIQVKL